MKLNQCGNGIIEGQEQCDDGNSENNDGCSSECKVDEGWQCKGEPSHCVKLNKCGNGIIEDQEQCDDGNSENNDGCSSECKVDEGWQCKGEPSHCVKLNQCGNGIIEGQEQCDDGNSENNDGCSSECKVDEGWQCKGEPSHCVKLNECGNGIIEGQEQCDDGNSENNDGCSSECGLEYDWFCRPNSEGTSVCQRSIKIIAWYSLRKNDITDENYKDLRDAGFTSSLSNQYGSDEELYDGSLDFDKVKEMYQYSAKYGIRLMHLLTVKPGNYDDEIVRTFVYKPGTQDWDLPFHANGVEKVFPVPATGPGSDWCAQESGYSGGINGHVAKHINLIRTLSPKEQAALEYFFVFDEPVNYTLRGGNTDSSCTSYTNANTIFGLIKERIELLDSLTQGLNLQRKIPYYVNHLSACMEPFEIFIQREGLGDKLPMVSFDHYWLRSSDKEGTDRKIIFYAYEGLELSHAIAKKYKKELWPFISAEHTKGDSAGFSPKPTIQDLRIQAYTNLAYGAKAIQYYPYLVDNRPNYDNPVYMAPFMGSNWAASMGTGKTEIYYTVKKMNLELQTMSKYFLDATDHEIYHLGKQYSALELGEDAKTRPMTMMHFIKHPYDTAYIKSVIRSSGELADKGAILSFYNIGQTRYLLIVSRDPAAQDSTKPPSVNIEIELAKPVTQISYTYNEHGGVATEKMLPAQNHSLKLPQSGMILLSYPRMSTP